MKVAIGCDHAGYPLKVAVEDKLLKEGIGISIAANKVKGVRCALCTSVEMAEMSRRHNDANVLAMGARMIEQDLAFKIVDRWFETGFEGGKHLRRINMLDD